jgi:hypothetical protein
VQQLAVRAVGAVLKPAEPVLVVEARDAAVLEIEAFVLNRDIGFVGSGQEAAVKVDTFEFTRYGLLPARVRSVSAEAVEHPQFGAVYPARVALERDWIAVGEGRATLVPGMAVQVEIRTGTRKVIEFRRRRQGGPRQHQGALAMEQAVHSNPIPDAGSAAMVPAWTSAIERHRAATPRARSPTSATQAQRRTRRRTRRGLCAGGAPTRRWSATVARAAGVPTMPRCGATRQPVEAVREHEQSLYCHRRAATRARMQLQSTAPSAARGRAIPR